MRKGMKFLRASILTLLLALCVAVAVLFVVHLTGGNDDETANPRVRDRITDDVQADDIVFSNIPVDQIKEDEAKRIWQRVMTQSEETGLWHYFPIVPWDVSPGETAVLGVSVVGFQGWEVDPNFAHVELFDETFDDENVYVSFIMPDKRPSIAALYDEIPYINIENTREMMMNMWDMHEYGNAPVPASEGGLRPEQGVTINMPPAIIGTPYNVRLNDPVIPDPEWDLHWEFFFPPELIDWMEWQASPMAVGRGGILRTKPGMTVPEPPGGPILFSVDISRVVDGINQFYDTYNFIIHIRNPGARPEIFTTSVPHAMVDVEYEWPIVTGFIPPGTTWDWDIVGIAVGVGGDLPDGLELWVDPADISVGAIIGTPTEDALFHGPSYSFRILIDPTTETIEDYPEFGQVFSEALTIRVYPRPVVTMSHPAWLEGLVGNPYNPTPFVTTPSNIISAAPTAGLPGIDALPNPSWVWTYTLASDRFDEVIDGIGLSPDPNDPSRIAITGVPTEAAAGKTFNIELFFRSNNRNLIIGETLVIPFTVYIWPRPVISALTDPWPDGMVGPPPASGEPLENYESRVRIEGALPDGTTTGAWSTTPAGSLPGSVTINTSGFTEAGVIYTTISGETPSTTDPDDYPFTVEWTMPHPNPNINAVLRENFNIRIWRRAYLRITQMLPTEQAPPGRYASRGSASEELEPWYDVFRAVIPGTYGQVRSIAPSNFIMWIVNTDSPGKPVIGNNWRYEPDTSGAWARAWVEMPKPANPADPALDVELTGWHTPIPTVIPNMRNGFVGDTSYVSTISLAAPPAPRPTAVQDQLDRATWGVVDPGFTAGDRIPPGTIMAPGSGAGPGLIVGTPSLAGVFNFNIGLTLPGSMRISYPTTGRYTILIENPRPSIGDVDNSGGVDLRDLMLLRMYISGELSGAPLLAFNTVNADTNQDGVVNHFDVIELARWFAGDGRMPTAPAP